MSDEPKTFSPEFLARTALDKAAIYQRLAQASLNATDKAHATAYQLLGECVLRLQQECDTLRQVVNAQPVARDDALGEFRRGVRAMFDCLLVGVANNYHANPVQQQRCAAENALVTTWAQDALARCLPMILWSGKRLMRPISAGLKWAGCTHVKTWRNQRKSSLLRLIAPIPK